MKCLAEGKDELRVRGLIEFIEFIELIELIEFVELRVKELSKCWILNDELR